MIFDPKTLPIASPALPFIADVILIAASGALVPNATIVRPMTICGMPNFLAIMDAPSTNQSAPFINMTNPTIKSDACAAMPQKSIPAEIVKRLKFIDTSKYIQLPLSSHKSNELSHVKSSDLTPEYDIIIIILCKQIYLSIFILHILQIVCRN